MIIFIGYSSLLSPPSLQEHLALDSQPLWQLTYAYAQTFTRAQLFYFLFLSRSIWSHITITNMVYLSKPCRKYQKHQEPRSSPQTLLVTKASPIVFPIFQLTPRPRSNHHTASLFKTNKQIKKRCVAPQNKANLKASQAAGNGADLVFKGPV